MLSIVQLAEAEKIPSCTHKMVEGGYTVSYGVMEPIPVDDQPDLFTLAYRSVISGRFVPGHTGRQEQGRPVKPQFVSPRRRFGRAL